jgi:hypothetical protein
MRRFRTLAVLLTTALAAAFIHTAPTAGAAPDAQVRIDPRAFEGPRGTILASLRLRCAPGFEFSDLVIEFRQGDVITPPTLGSAIPCDGRWHRQKVSSPEAFEPGAATMSARLSVIDAETGDPGEQAFESTRIFVRPAARVWLPPTAKLTRAGDVRIVVRARCDEPWLLQDFLVEGSQAAGTRYAFDLLSLPCDGTVRPRTAILERDSGRFTRGRLEVMAALSLLDPEFFDPVTTATASRVVQVR